MLNLCDKCGSVAVNDLKYCRPLARVYPVGYIRNCCQSCGRIADCAAYPIVRERLDNLVTFVKGRFSPVPVSTPGPVTVPRRMDISKLQTMRELALENARQGRLEAERAVKEKNPVFAAIYVVDAFHSQQMANVIEALLGGEL